MKKRIVAVLLSAAMIFTMAPVSPVSAAPEGGDDSVPAVQVDAENPGNNIALKATADASYTNTYGISPASMNDGELATSDPYSSWNSWGTDDESYPVTTSLTWDYEQVITGMRVSEYMYTVHGDKLFVNMYIGSDGNVNVDGTNVGLIQETEYPWNGDIKMTVNPDEEKEFTMNIRIPGWVEEQANQNVTISVNGEAVTAEAEKGYVAITRTWNAGDVVRISIPMEIRMTEADPNVEANQGRIALQRGPIVYSIEMAGNAQLNSDIANFSPLNFVIPRDAELTATYNEDLLNGVVEITGDVKYNNNGEIIDAKLQAIPYYAWNNRGNDGVEGQNNCSQMLIWTNTSGASVKIGGDSQLVIGDTTVLNALAAGMDNPTYAWTVDGDAVEITDGGKTATFTVTVEEGRQPADPGQKPSDSQKPSGGQDGDQTDKAVQTGDTTNLFLPAAGMLMAAALLFVAWKKRRTEK